MKTNISCAELLKMLGPKSGPFVTEHCFSDKILIILCSGSSNCILIIFLPLYVFGAGVNVVTLHIACLSHLIS